MNESETNSVQTNTNSSVIDNNQSTNNVQTVSKETTEPVTQNNEPKGPETKANELPEEKILLNGSDQVIKQVKPKRNRGAFSVFVIFVLLIGFVFFLPELTPYIDQYVEKYLHKTPVSTGSKPVVEDPKIEDPEIKEKEYFELKSDLTISVDSLEFSKIVIDSSDKTIRFNIKNTGKSLFDFSTKYFIELYNDDLTLLNRIMVKSDFGIQANGNTSLQFPIKEQALNATKIAIVNINTTEYPNVDLKDRLICKNDYFVVTYNFEEGKLKSLTDKEVFYQKDYLENYDTIKQQLKQLSEKYSAINGIDITLNNNEDSIETITSIDYRVVKNSDLSDFNNSELFKLDEEIRVVNFEMEASGYNCN